MKIEINKKKTVDTISGIVQSSVKIGKKTVGEAKAGVEAIAKKTKEAQYTRKVEKYNPIFPEHYRSKDFNIPNIVAIVDDAVRRGIDVCEGAIGWLGEDAGEEVLYLYDEAIEFSGIEFVPVPVCNAVYYVDNFDRGRFIQADGIFGRTLKEKLDELQRVAEFIGAKRCKISISEANSSIKMKQKDVSAGGETSRISADVVVTHEELKSISKKQYGFVEAEFGGLRFPKRPTLKWFKYDDSINNLIDTCCSGKRRVKKMTLELAGSSSTTMSQSTACAIDGVLKQLVGIKGRISMKNQAKEEAQSKIFFNIEF